jgi:methylenetetrahydrofolate dehydrogenase (NADP+) / methenyltetrahydrofolate cyclohydrolase
MGGEPRLGLLRMADNFKIGGRNLKNKLIERFNTEYGERIAAANLKVEILRFATPEFQEPLTFEQKQKVSQYTAAEDSRKAKTESFRSIGIEVPERGFLPQDMVEEDFQRLIDKLNNNPSVNGIIIQYPVPNGLEGLVKTITPDKDLDALSNNKGIFKIPATSEGIARVIVPFLKNDSTVAIVGSQGFVGQGVEQFLTEIGINVIPIDQRLPEFKNRGLIEVRDADIVVSVTGQPGVLDERHLTESQVLVVDGGYVPMRDADGKEQKYGDVARSATGIPQFITIVPGGVGPIEMAILMERIIEKYIDPEIQRWRLEDYISEVKEYKRKVEEASVADEN